MKERLIIIDADSGGNGYDLYEALKDGSPQQIQFYDETYTMQLCGNPYGAENFLLVRAEDGTEKRWGWGWNQDVCFECLQDIREGWEQAENYRPYRVKITEES